jgi:hypothetical protein
VIKKPFLALLLLILWGCGEPPVKSVSAGSPPVKSQSADITILPTSAVVGSPDLTLVIDGSNFGGKRHFLSEAVWSANGSTVFLATTFVSSTRLTAVVPAALLAAAVTAKVFVQTGDPMGDSPLRMSTSVLFSVTAASAATPSIISISPGSVTAASPDLTLTITGSNFVNYESVALWTTNPNNLHDYGTMLNTTFDSDTQLTAVIPGALLRNPGFGQIVVLTGDPMGMSDGFFGYPKSNSVTFIVSP